MKMFKVIKNFDFQFNGRYYWIAQNPINSKWHVTEYNSLWDYIRRWGTPGKQISKDFDDLNELLRVATIESRTIIDIIKDVPEKEFSKKQPFPYNYDRFITDIFNRMTFGFTHRGKFYCIRYWSKNHNDPKWIPGWKFCADKSEEVLIYSKSFDEFIHQVNLWMMENVGISLREMFDCDYMEDNSGKLQMEMIGWTPL